jgi:uncharacterized protein
MRIVIAGGLGFLGRALTRRLLDGGHDVTVLTRSGIPGADPERPRVVLWNPDGSTDVWAHALEDADAVVNLAGAGIADQRWTDARKAMLQRSRLMATLSLVKAVASTIRRPSVFIQGCAVGYYGASLDARTRDETDPAGSDFLARLCAEWETAAEPIAALGCRLVTLRTGIVLSPDGGALPLMALPFKLFVGGRTGSGRQYLPWIHVDDWVALVAWAIGNPGVCGPLNACAPNPVTNADFSSALGRALGRPDWIPVPSFVMRMVVGREMADVALLNGQRAVPARALAGGFRFSHPDIDEALSDLFNT